MWSIWTESSLFIFCGHGAGEKVCDLSKLKKCYCPAALLWGCSSGHLPAKGVHDPNGAALQYLSSGAPYVIANLWDVTDKDIDKLSVECMRILFHTAEQSGLDKTKTTRSVGLLSKINNSEEKIDTQNEDLTLAAALMKARDACKMGHAVGSAPVMYGLPARTVV